MWLKRLILYNPIAPHMTYIKCEEGIQTYPKIKFETSKIPNTIKNRCLTIKIAKNLLDVKERSINPIPKT